MLRFLSKLVRKFQTANTARTPRRAPRRAMLGLEGLEDRLVLSTLPVASASLNLKTETLSVKVFRQNEQITLAEDKLPGNLDVLLGGAPLLTLLPIAAIKNVEVSLTSLDTLNINDSHGFPFAAGTTISISGSGGADSFKLFGSVTVNGGEEYIVGGTAATKSSLLLGGSTILFNSAIGTVKDTVTITGPLQVATTDPNATLVGSNGVTQTLFDLGPGGGGTLIYSNKIIVEVDQFGANASVNLNATARAAGEKLFTVNLHGANDGAPILATPNNVATSVDAIGQNDGVSVNASSGPVFITGNSSTSALLGTGFGLDGITSGILANVSVQGVGSLTITNSDNGSRQENVKVTESTVSGTGLFGKNTVVVAYSNIGSLQINTGQLADTYTIAGSKPGATFANPIEIVDDSEVGLNVSVTLTARSGLDLNLDNAEVGNPAPASLFISALGGTFNPNVPVTPTGSETVTFPGGLTSVVEYTNFTSVTNFDGPHNLL
jgi:hypothetical protein